MIRFLDRFAVGWPHCTHVEDEFSARGEEPCGYEMDESPGTSKTRTGSFRFSDNVATPSAA
jgi:hypothetical protein